MADLRFDLRAPTTALFPGDGIALNQTRVHQQLDYDETAQLMYVTQVLGSAALADESEPAPSGLRDSRGDLAISRVNLAGQVTGAMYVRRFDHGSGIGVENVGGTAYLWLAFDAIQQPIGTNAHGRRLCRIPFVNGAIIDPEDVPADQAYEPIPGATSITPGLDLAHNRMGIAYSTGSGTRYRVYDLDAFKARDFSKPLYEFARPSFPDFQGWCLWGNYVYQNHGSAWDSETNPPPPNGTGDAWFTVIDIRTGEVVDRVHNTTALSLPWRELEGISVWNRPEGPRLVFGFATRDPAPRLMALYAIDTVMNTSVDITATAVTGDDPGVVLTTSVFDVGTVESWEISRTVSGSTQVLFEGEGVDLPSEGVWKDDAPPGCLPMTYRLTLHRTNGVTEAGDSNEVIYEPDGGCGSLEAVGGEPDVLGCAESYTAMIHWRGGALPFPASTMENLTKVAWSRTINDVSDASVTVLKGDIDPECCQALGKIEPWVHELTIYRDGQLVWQGPLLRSIERRNSFTLQAVDVSAWLDHIVNTWRVTYTSTDPDDAGRKKAPITYVAWNHIRLNVTDPRLSVPADFPGIMPYIVRRDGRLPKIKVEKDGSSNTSIWTEYLGEMLREWTKRGLTWTAVGRALLLRGRPNSTTRATARLTLEDIAGDVEVIKDGSQAATYGYSTTQEQQDISKGKTLGTGRIGTPYGRLDTLTRIQEEEVTDADLREAARDSIAGRYPAPVSISVPDGSQLVPSAPVTMRQLVPGERFDVLTTGFCTPVAQGFVLSDLEVDWDTGGEKVGVTFIPLADVDEELIA